MPVPLKDDTRIFRYVVAYDYGTAPRPFGGVCSLAICKPGIRAAARRGDWVIGFRSRRPGEVIYAMEVQEILPFADYWSDPRFADRRPDATDSPDNIYRSGPGGQLIQVENSVHGPDHVARDLRGRNVLVSRQFWYFGRNSVPIPNHLLHLVHTGQGHAVHKGRRPGDVPALREWLAAWPPGRHGSPVDSRQPIAVVPGVIASPSPQKRLPVKFSAPQVVSCGGSRRVAKATTFAANAPGRLVFSRKGFDSGYGGMPSPILPDGRILSLPIPAAHDSVPLGCVGHEDPELFAALINDLSCGRHSVDTRVHLDPDLDPLARARPLGWRPALGQTGAAQTHLARQGVGRGDVFLFFGWFREVERKAGKWRFARAAPHLHLLFGWLEVADILPIVAQRDETLRRNPWAAAHVHAENPSHYTSPLNHLYVGPERSRYAARGPGGGRFGSYSSALQLTAPGSTKSVWDVPAWLGPGEGRAPLSYHSDPGRWEQHGSGWRLRTVAKGQEFVCQLDGRDTALAWLQDLIQVNAIR